MMTKTHFEAIAEALRNTRPLREARPGSAPRAMRQVLQWSMDVESVANMCAKSNPLFKRDTFYDACGYTAAYGREV